MDALQLRNNAKQQLAEIKTIETGITYLNKVKAIEAWAKAEKKDAELQNLIAEQKLRTQRKLGGLLKEDNVSKNSGSRYGNLVTKDDQVKLSDIGISKNESSTFQKIALLPEEIFEKEISTAKDESSKRIELTTSRMLQAAKQYEVKTKKDNDNIIENETKIINEFDFVFNDSILNIQNNIPDNIKLLLTDPPYGQNFVSNRRVISEKEKGIINDENISDALKLLDDTLNIIFPKMANDSFAFIFTSWLYEPEFRKVFEKYFILKNSIIWNKNNHSSGDLLHSFAPKHERILFGLKGNPKLKYRLPDVLEGNDIITTHPTSKPIDLLKKLISVTTYENDVLFDPFSGHGSTLIAGIDLKRRVYGSEIDSENYKNIIYNINERF